MSYYQSNYIMKQGVMVALSARNCKSWFQNSKLIIKGDCSERTIEAKKSPEKAEVEPKPKEKDHETLKRKPGKHWRYRIKAALKLKRFKKPTLLTISYPQGTTDKECHRLLNIWFTRMRKFKEHLLYIWVAERQKNGTLHFHIILSEAYPLAHLKEIMRESLKGIYANWENYNGMDVRRIKGKEKMAKYLTKYLTKSPEGANCSKALRYLNTASVQEQLDESIEFEPIIYDRWFSVFTHKATQDYLFDFMFSLNDRLIDDRLLQRFVSFKIQNITYSYI